jgi:protein arginine kinase
MDSRLQKLLETEPGWLQAGGPESDVVVSSRVRLARNVAGFAFPQQLNADRADELAAASADCLRRSKLEGVVLEPRSLGAADADLIVERSLATRDLMSASRPTQVFFCTQGLHGVMVNEEDHFRIQGLAAGLNLNLAFERAQRLERRLRNSFDFAVSDRFGFLTSCPTNTGSGMRASLMLHLPALARAKANMQRALQAARVASLAVRGVHGEGSHALGHFYQISNQRTMGVSAQDQLKAVTDFGLVVAGYERDTRQKFCGDTDINRVLREDLVAAIDLLGKAEALTTAQALDALSILRLGALLNLTADFGFASTPERLLSLCFKLQPGHLQARTGNEMSPEQRDVARAALLKMELGFGG